MPLAKFPAPKRLEVSRWTKTGCLAVDFVDPESTGRFLEKLKSLPALYICVSNAGLTRHGPLDDVTEEAWDATNDVNLKAPFLRQPGGGRDHETGRVRPDRERQIDLGGHMTMAERSIYTATKHGLRGLSISYAIEWPGSTSSSTSCPRGSP